jgi:hypothetical protein
MMYTELQVEELYYLLFESGAGPHLCPHIEHRGQELLTQPTHPHTAVHGSRPQEDVQSRDQVLHHCQVSLLPGENISHAVTVGLTVDQRRLVGGAIGGQAHCNGWNGINGTVSNI